MNPRDTDPLTVLPGSRTDRLDWTHEEGFRPTPMADAHPFTPRPSPRYVWGYDRGFRRGVLAGFLAGVVIGLAAGVCGAVVFR